MNSPESTNQDSIEQEVARRIADIQTSQDVVIFCLATLAESDDSNIGLHIQRTQGYIRTLCNQLKDNPKFSDILTDDYINMVVNATPLHDIGKAGIPDSILNKPDQLNEEEWKEMQRHVEYGLDAIVKAEQQLGKTQFLDVVKDLIRTHHEKWDGTGYPGKLKGEQIPLAGRLMAMADVYDAITHIRVYKVAFPHKQAIEWIIEQSGSHFDPDLVDAFKASVDEFNEIIESFSEVNT